MYGTAAPRTAHSLVLNNHHTWRVGTLNRNFGAPYAWNITQFCRFALNKMVRTGVAKLNKSQPEESENNSREFTREPVKMTAQLLVSQGYRFKVSVLDISASGFRIETANDIPMDRKVYLTIPGFQPLQGRVAWCRRDQYGCEFSQKLHDSVFSHVSSAFPSLVV